MAYSDPEPDDNKPLGIGGWLIILLLVALLIWAGWFGYTSWTAVGDVKISTAGWIFLGLGIVVTTLVGAGLMFLVFYSSRKHYDR
jgi:fumarate reductase subunit D